MAMNREMIKKGIIVSVSVSIGALILVIFLTQSEFTLSALGRVNLNYLILAAVMMLMFWLLRSLKIKVLINTLGGRVSLYRVFNIYLASVFVSHVTPSSFGGLPFQIYFLHKEGLPLGKTTALTVLDGMVTFIFFLAVTPFLLLAWGKYLNLSSRITGLFYFAIVLVSIFIIGSLILIFNSHLAMVFVNWLTGQNWFKRFFKEETLQRFRDFVEKELRYFNEGIHILAGSKRDMFLVIIYTIFYWIFYLGLAPVLLKGLGLKIAIPPIILAQLVFNFIQPIIPTPGGSGGAELGFAYLFKFMVPSYLLGIFVVVWRFFMFYTSLVVGGFYFVKLVQGTDYLNND